MPGRRLDIRRAGHGGTHGNGAPVGIEQRIDRQHLRLEFLARHCVQLHLHALTWRNAALVALGQAEVHGELGRVLEVHQRVAHSHVLPEVDAAQAERAIKGGRYAHALHARFRQRHLGLGHLKVRLAFFHHALGHEILGHQFLVALEVRTGDGQLRLRLAQFGSLQGVVQLHQQLARRTWAPSAKAMRATRPAVSGLMVTLCRDLREPTACASSCSGIVLTRATSTLGGPPALLIRPAGAGFDAPLAGSLAARF
jgi:hypothetical protein